MQLKHPQIKKKSLDSSSILILLKYQNPRLPSLLKYSKQNIAKSKRTKQSLIRRLSAKRRSFNLDYFRRILLCFNVMLKRDYINNHMFFSNTLLTAPRFFTHVVKIKLFYWRWIDEPGQVINKIVPDFSIEQ